MGEKYNPADLLKQNRQDRVNPYESDGGLQKVGETYGKMISLMNENFNKGKIDEALCNRGFEQLDGLIEKAGHRYIRREGTPGNYKYVYAEDAKKGDHVKTTQHNDKNLSRTKDTVKDLRMTGKMSKEDYKKYLDGGGKETDYVDHGKKEKSISEEYDTELKRLKGLKAKVDDRADKTHNYAEGKQLLKESDKLKNQIEKLEKENKQQSSEPEENDFEPDGKIRSRLKMNLSLDTEDLNTFIDSIKNQDLEDKVFGLFTGWSNSREQGEMYERIERELDMAGYDAAHLD